MDKVLVIHALQTLNVIAIGLLCATICGVVLTGILTYIFSHTSSKIDVELGARLFNHLLTLSISYFHVRRVSDSVSRIRELEIIWKISETLPCIQRCTFGPAAQQLLL